MTVASQTDTYSTIFQVLLKVKTQHWYVASQLDLHHIVAKWLVDVALLQTLWWHNILTLILCKKKKSGSCFNPSNISKEIYQQQ